MTKRIITTVKIKWRLQTLKNKTWTQFAGTKTACNIGFAARLAGHWSNGHFIAVVLHLGWTNIAELLFVNLYFYIFIQQRFRADQQWIPALQQALLVTRQFFCIATISIIKAVLDINNSGSIVIANCQRRWKFVWKLCLISSHWCERRESLLSPAATSVACIKLLFFQDKF